MDALYRLFVLPDDFFLRGGSWLPYDRGLVRVSWMCTAEMKWLCIAQGVDGQGDPDRGQEVARIGGLIVVKALDAYGISLQGRNNRTDKVENWRLEPLRPGVCDNWREVYERQEKQIVEAIEARKEFDANCDKERIS